MFRAFLLILVVTIAGSFDCVRAQTPNQTPQSNKFDEFGLITREDTQVRFEIFWSELKKDPTATGYVVNYGRTGEIARTEHMVKNFIRFLRLDPARFMVVRGGFLKKPKTEFWIVPAGAEAPKLIPAPRILDEFGKLGRAQWKKRLANVEAKFIGNDATAQLVIINYGTDKEIAAAESFIREYLGRCCDRFNQLRVMIVRGGTAKKPRRVFWIVPAGAELPTP